jgi:hypothetical protein
VRTTHCECGCGEIIIQDSDHDKRYVNNVHKQRAYVQRKKNERNKAKIVGIERKCLNCGERFIARTDRHVFHSTSCRSSYWQQMKRLSLSEEQ